MAVNSKVDLLTPQVAPSVRPAGQVSTAQAQQLYKAGEVAQGVADQFTLYYEEKARLAGEMILARAEEYWTREFADREKGVGFADTLLSDYDAYIEQAMEDYQSESTALGMRHLPARNKEQILHQFSQYRLKMETQALQAEAAARAAAAARAKQETLNSYANTLISRIELDPDDPSIIADLARMSEGLDADSVTYLNRVYLNGMIEHKPGAVNEMVAQGDFDAHLTPSQKQTVLNNSRVNLSALSDAAEREYSPVITEGINFTIANGISDALEDTIASIQADERLTEEASLELVRMAEEGLRHGLAMNHINNATPQERAGHLAWLDTRVQTEGSTASDVADRDAYKAALNTFYDNLSEDPAKTAVWSNQAVANAFHKFQSAGSGTSHEDTELGLMEHVPSSKEWFAEFVSRIDSWYDSQGLPQRGRTYLPLDETQFSIENLVADMNANDLGTVHVQLKAWESILGEKYGGVLTRMRNNGLNPAVFWSGRYIDDPNTLNMLKESQNLVFADLKRQFNEAESFDNLAEDIRTELDGWGPAFQTAGGPAANTDFEELVQLAQKSAMDLILNKDVGISDAIAQVMAAYFPERAVYSPERNLSVLIPTYIRNDVGDKIPSDNGAIIEGLTFAALNPDYWGSNFVGINIDDYTINYDIPVEGGDEALTAASVKERGMWVNSPDGKGVVLLHRMEADWSFAPVRHEVTGDPAFLSWEELDKVGDSIISMQATDLVPGAGMTGIVDATPRPAAVPSSAVLMDGKWIDPLSGLEYDVETGVLIENF